MKKYVLSIIFVMLIFLSVSAQGRKLTREEFRAKKEAFIVQEANLTTDEAAKFFPIFFELQSRKKRLMDISWQIEKNLHKGNATEAQYAVAVIQFNNARIACDKLDRSYLHRFVKILSYEKIYKVMHSEIKFHREMLKGMRP